MRIALIITLFFSLYSLSHSTRWSTGGIVSRYNNIGHSNSVFPFTGFNFAHNNDRTAHGFRNSFDFRPPPPPKPTHRRRNSENLPPREPSSPKCKPKLDNLDHSAQTTGKCKSKLVAKPPNIVHEPPKQSIAPIIKPEIIVEPVIIHQRSQYIGSQVIEKTADYAAPKPLVINLNPQSILKQDIIVDHSIDHQTPDYSAPHHPIIVNPSPEHRIIDTILKPELIVEPSIDDHSPAQGVEPIIIPHTPHEYSAPKPLINGNAHHTEPVGILRQHNFIGNHGFSYSTNYDNNYKLPYSGSVYGYGIPSFGKKYDSSPLIEPVHISAPKQPIISDNSHKHDEPNGILYMYNFIGKHGFAYTTNYDKNYVLPYAGSVYGYGLPSFGKKYVSQSSSEHYESPQPPKGFKASTGGIVWRYNNLGYLKYGLPYQGYKVPYDSSVFGYGIPTNGKSYDYIRHHTTPSSPPHQSAKIESIDEDVWKYINVGYENYGTKPYSGYTIPYDSSVFGYGIPYFGKPDGHVAQNYGNIYTSHDDTVYDKTVGYKSPYYTNIYGYGVPFVGNDGVCNDAHQRYMFERLGILVCNDLKKK